MINNVRLLSLCIPTNGATQFVLPVLDSIYSQGVDDTLFEVVITDNGKESNLGEAIESYRELHGNLDYYKSELTGFVNQVDSFKHSHGLFIKMINHRAKLLPGALYDLISLVDRYKDTQPVIYCSDGVLRLNEITEYKNFDVFVKDLSYYSSWSAGVGIWAKDKPQLEQIEYNEMFPHASIIFETRLNTDYVIWNRKFMEMGEESTKGGYNIFHTFAVVYLDLLKDLERRGRIRTQTFKSVKKDLRRFLSVWYYGLIYVPNQYTFKIDDNKKHILVYYNYIDYMIIKYRGRVASFVNTFFKNRDHHEIDIKI